MARSRFNDPIEPMDLANMLANGVRSLDIQCHNCRRRAIMNIDHLPGNLTVPSPDRLCITIFSSIRTSKENHAQVRCDGRIIDRCPLGGRPYHPQSGGSNDIRSPGRCGGTLRWHRKI
jgi:hypothetical protein